MLSFWDLVGEIALLEGLTVVYKSNIDLFFYVIGSSHENEVGNSKNMFIFFFHNAVIMIIIIIITVMPER